MSLFDQFETDDSKEVEGVEVQYAPNKDGSIPTFLLSRMGKKNKKYQKYLDKMTKPVSRQLSLGTLSEEESDRIFVDVFVTTVLKGWNNVLGRDGKPMAFNKENGIMLMKALPDLYDDLTEKAKSAALFRDDTNEDDAKN